MNDLFDKHELDIAGIRKRCESSIRNTPVGVHLGKCLDEIERLRKQNQEMREAITKYIDQVTRSGEDVKPHPT